MLLSIMVVRAGRRPPHQQQQASSGAMGATTTTEMVVAVFDMSSETFHLMAGPRQPRGHVDKAVRHGWPVLCVAADFWGGGALLDLYWFLDKQQQQLAAGGGSSGTELPRAVQRRRGQLPRPLLEPKGSLLSIYGRSC
jgi:hypothetical protein